MMLLRSAMFASDEEANLETLLGNGARYGGAYGS